MLFSTLFPLYCIFVAVSSLPLTTNLDKRQVSDPYHNLCELKWFMPVEAFQWARYDQPILSSHSDYQYQYGSLAGLNVRKTVVDQGIVIDNKGPKRHFEAVFRGKNWVFAPYSFSIAEYYDTPDNNTPDLTESYYIVNFTDENGHGYNGGYIIHMPKAGPYDTKFCQVHVPDMNDDQLTFTINQYVSPVGLR